MQDKINPALYIDSTLLTFDATLSSLILLCDEAKKYEFSIVFVRPVRFAQRAYEQLCNSKVKVGTVIGFPQNKDIKPKEIGNMPLEDKIKEFKQIEVNHAQEFDIVMNCRQFLKEYDEKDYNAKPYTKTIKELKTLIDKAHGRNATAKIIIETGTLELPGRIAAATEMCRDAGADYVKTSTGYGKRGASLKDIERIKDAWPEAKIKASGGITDYKTALEFIKAGCHRIGTSNAKKIMEEYYKLLG